MSSRASLIIVPIIKKKYNLQNQPKGTKLPKMKVRKLKFSDTTQFNQPRKLKKLKLLNLTKALMGRKSSSEKHVSQIPLPPANLLEIIRGDHGPKLHSSNSSLVKGRIGLRKLFFKKNDGTVSQARRPSEKPERGQKEKKKLFFFVPEKKNNRSNSANFGKEKKGEACWPSSLRYHEEMLLSPEVVSMMRPFTSSRSPGINFISSDTVNC